LFKNFSFEQMRLFRRKQSLRTNRVLEQAQILLKTGK
jgi:hypothetical protein